MPSPKIGFFDGVKSSPRTPNGLRTVSPKNGVAASSSPVRYKGIAGISFSISADLKKKAFSISVDSYFKISTWVTPLSLTPYIDAPSSSFFARNHVRINILELDLVRRRQRDPAQLLVELLGDLRFVDSVLRRQRSYA
ncbi:uncharacterized protein LOC127239599 isoform X3 [Andrographis paniculata]|uniref:uncharacterized protein LOC127239599 isoform X3 n=1 Tax=Andrographis paniculata TaxID=175694 RepID=UPI0021E6FEE1|nr:uncharacterized protein LOC127239599 isoform X3 [Andrographis paniculata]